ncbi:MAG TPA: class I SAM-dependent methyltransferase [Candidatus Acidoferrales bacterium]|nr:class I SAM-dependent methyltransferase [Candidatus Acidoferrales bacterium]
MTGKVDLYNTAYGNYSADVYREIRLETYGQDFGQTSWVTTEESNEIPRALGVRSGANVLEIGCGSGHYTLHVAETTGCRIVAVDINEAGVRNANRLAEARSMGSRVRFQPCDVSKTLPFQDAGFDAAFANDVLCHVPERLALLQELTRVLRPGGKLLFSDALVIGGMITHQELSTRSSIGLYVFSPPGENERLIEQSGFRLLGASDTTANAATIAKRWRDARERRKGELVAVEGEATFCGVQEFLSCVHTLTSERRLLRYLYLAEKP